MFIYVLLDMLLSKHTFFFWNDIVYTHLLSHFISPIPYHLIYMCLYHSLITLWHLFKYIYTSFTVFVHNVSSTTKTNNINKINCANIILHTQNKHISNNTVNVPLSFLPHSSLQKKKTRHHYNSFFFLFSPSPTCTVTLSNLYHIFIYFLPNSHVSSDILNPFMISYLLS